MRRSRLRLLLLQVFVNLELTIILEPSLTDHSLDWPILANLSQPADVQTKNNCRLFYANEFRGGLLYSVFMAIAELYTAP